MSEADKNESGKEDARKLAARRAALKGSLTRMKNKVAGGLDNASLQMLQLLEEKATATYAQYEGICLDILDDEDPSPTEECYLECVAALRTRIAQVGSDTTDTKGTPTSSNTSKLKLPDINLKPFDGRYIEYKPFQEMFQVLVHNDRSLSDIQKFFYLKNFVKGDAYELIKNLPVLGSSYGEALNILSQRYDNHFKIVNEHICNLFDLPTMNKSNVSALRSLISVTKQHLAALKNLGEPINAWDSILVCMLARKLDPITSRAYHLERDNSVQPTFSNFIQFLEGRALALENCEAKESTSSAVCRPVAVPKVANVVVKEIRCLFCSKCDHKMFSCPKFMLASIKERLAFVKDRELCMICLNSHRGKCKFHFKCQHCKQSHNTLLHSENNDNYSNESKQDGKSMPNVSLNSVASSAKNQVLLPTARVKVIDKNGKEIIAKALLDSGSQTSFISSQLANTLGKKLLPNSTSIMGIANTEQFVKKSLQLDIFSCVYPYKINTNLLVVDKITTNLPQTNFDITTIKMPKGIKLADESYNETSKIDILLAADILFQVLLPQPKQPSYCDAAQPTQPNFIHTQFGWVVGGRVPVSHLRDSAVALFCQECQSDIHDTIGKFWQTEKVPEVYAEHTSEQQHCEEYFSDTVELENNKFTVAIPLKIPIYDVNNTLGDSFSLALKRFLNLEKRFHKDEQLHKDYTDFIHEYLNLGHGSYIDISSYDLSRDPVYFLPHHAVIKQDAITTKLRTVFDGSMRTSNKISLNDLMLNGPIVQQELFDILLSFRVHKYFFACDIRRMFRNILIKKEQRSLQNILWRDSPNEPIKCIQLSTVTYGLKSSSYLATRCLKELANRFEAQYPLASSVLLNSTYIDDAIHTDDNLANIIETKNQLIDLLAKGSFELHKWSANDKSILENISEQQQNFGEVELNKDIKTLGIKFDINTDSFKLSCPMSNEIPKTKRQILSYISKFFDPLGIAGPVFVQAKVIMQKLWQSSVSWDSTLPPLLQSEWLQFYNDLQAMKPISIKRNVCLDNVRQAQIVAFSDASILAFGAAVYLRVIDDKGNVKMSLLCSKSRVAPKDNKLSVPRLELNAALLMSKLTMRVYNTIIKKLPIQSVHLYSDSQVVLAWQKTDPAKLNTYVANRIKLINEYTKTFQWSYIKTNQNPADLLSRGLNPSELQHNQLWWCGPAFIADPNYKFSEFAKCEVPSDLPEVKCAKQNVLVCAASQCKLVSFYSSLLDNYSNINRATHVLAYIMRFCKNIKPGSTKVKANFVTYSETNQALHLFIKDEQSKYFKKDLISLQAGRRVSSYLLSLNPFIDANGILRIGGRLQHSSLPYSQKHQIILPKESRVTYLIIENEHLKLLHASQKEVLSSLSQRYWIVNGLRLVKKYVNKCMTCFRLKGVTATQLMGSLPAGRVNADRPFQKVGIDFAGPTMIKQSRVRNVILTKGYIAIYVCFVTKAIHLELVSDLTTDTFLASFKRFIARRNVPTEVYCDNASTFKSASSKLDELYRLNNSKCHQSQVQSATAKLGITFHFIPSYSPVFGALWESAVRLMKYHLKRVLCANVLTYEELYTVLVQIESILNSRPITPLSSDIEDLSFLTPGHFLTGAPLTCYPEQDITNLPDNRLKFWRKCTALKQHFWRYWSKQYLNVLQNRPKWKEAVPNVKEGALVILREIDTPPMTWPMARVTKVFPGQDGKVRALEVKKANGKVHTTSITKVCILPLDQ